jgi:hypothetical protein
MKKNLVLFILLLNTVILHGHGLELSEEANVIRQITMCIYDDFTSTNKELPRTFDSIPTLREWVDRDQSVVSFVNRLAIVPGSPTIRLGQGFSNKFANYNLFAISRNNSFDKVLSSEGAEKESGGRHSILIKEGDIRVMWIPENEVQIILNQIKDFNPEKQPYAFQNLSSEKGQRPPDRNVRNSFQPIPSDGKASATAPSLPKVVATAAEPVLTENLTSWPAGLVGLLVILLGYLGVKYFRKKPDGGAGE